MRSFGSSSTFVNATTPYYDLQTTLQRNLVSTGFSADGLQYANGGSFFRSKNALQGEGFSGESLECSDSYSYFDANGGGIPPAFPPSDPFPTTVKATSITVNFSSQGSSGDPPAAYGIYYGVFRPDTFFPSFNAFGSLYVTTVTGLLPGTKYYFQAIAQNSQGFLLSGITEVTTASVPPTPLPPSGPPTVPTLFSATSSSLTIQFDVAGITGSPYPSFQGRFGGIYFPAVQISGTIYQATATGLSPNTSYTCASSAYNESARDNSVGVPFSTLPAALTPPSSAPSVPSLILASTTSITIQFDVDGISGNPMPTYYADQGATQLTAVLTSGTKYQATATGLQPGTSYSFTSSATNSQGTKTSGSASFSTSSGPPPPPTSLQSLYLLTFLVYYVPASGPSFWGMLNQASDIGTWIFTGSSAGQIQGNTGQSVIPYLKSLQAKGCKIMVSFGGGGLTSTALTEMLGNPTAVANTIVYNLLSKGTKGSNDKSWASGVWSDFAFDGIDFDFEGNEGNGLNLLTTMQNVRNLMPDIIITGAPEISYSSGGFPTAPNGNGDWFMLPTSNSPLSSWNTAGSTKAWLQPTNMSSIKVNYVFVQVYNQGSGWYPTDSPTVFTGQLAAWGLTCLKGGAKLVIGLASTDANPGPIFNSATDSSSINTAITAANTAIQSYAPQYASTQISDWLAGCGFWNSPTANPVIAGIYSPSGGMPVLPATSVTLYLGQNPAANPGWTGPVPNTRLGS